MHLLQRFGTGHGLEGIVPGVMSTDIALEGTLLDQDSRSMIDQWKIGVTSPSVDRALVLENEYMLTGKGWMLFRFQRLRQGGPGGGNAWYPATFLATSTCVTARICPRTLVLSIFKSVIFIFTAFQGG